MRSSLGLWSCLIGAQVLVATAGAQGAGPGSRSGLQPWPGPTLGLSQPLKKSASFGSPGVAPPGSGGWFDVQAFGATGDDDSDDTIAIQQAIDAAEKSIPLPHDAGVPVVYFPPGRYRISDTDSEGGEDGVGLVWRSAHIMGAFPNNSVRVYWDGPAGATAIVKDSASSGGLSFGKMSGLGFRPGQNEPETWLDLASGDFAADKFLMLEQLHLLGCTGDAIRFTSWINLHMRDMRWDNVGGWALHLAPGGGQFLSSFALERFTYDHSRQTGPGSGFIRIDASQNASNLGSFRVSNGRIEINQPWSYPQSVISLAIEIPQGVGLHLSDVTYQDGAEMVDDCLLHIGGSPRQGLRLTNVRTSDIASIHGGGNWPAGSPANLPTGLYSSLNFDNGWNLATDLDLRDYAGTDEATLRVRGGADTEARFEVWPNGRLAWGDGASATDVGLFREQTGGVATLTTDGDLSVEGALRVGGGAPLAAHLSSTVGWDPPYLGPGASTVLVMQAPLASVGDVVAVGFDGITHGAAVLVGGQVTQQGLVTVTLVNLSSSAAGLDLPSGTLRTDVWKH